MKLVHLLNIKCYGTHDQKKRLMDYVVWQCLDGGTSDLVSSLLAQMINFVAEEKNDIRKA